mmetsp:Transcript_57090/g.105550  ORF Transcript_57090/g.105550 Transcript_57090/m.105550 type:complete len:263 (+) Transcript_57090:334-1122(+)
MLVKGCHVALLLLVVPCQLRSTCPTLAASPTDIVSSSTCPFEDNPDSLSESCPIDDCGLPGNSPTEFASPAEKAALNAASPLLPVTGVSSSPGEAVSAKNSVHLTSPGLCSLAFDEDDEAVALSSASPEEDVVDAERARCPAVPWKACRRRCKSVQGKVRSCSWSSSSSSRRGSPVCSSMRSSVSDGGSVSKRSKDAGGASDVGVGNVVLMALQAAETIEGDIGRGLPRVGLTCGAYVDVLLHSAKISRTPAKSSARVGRGA